MITTHVLDTAIGRPGAGIAIELDIAEGSSWKKVGSGTTDSDGRLKTLTPAGPVAPGTYKLRFATGAYFSTSLEAEDRAAFFPLVEIHFTVVDGTQHFHVPLLLSPFGYSTYRGS